MAAAAPDGGSVAEMESLLTCSICLETLKEPRTLGCFHSFCKCCLQKYVKRQREQEAGKVIEAFGCPLCRTQFSLKQGEKVEGMLPNHFIGNMLEVLEIQLRAKELPCFSRGSQRPAVSRCITCDKYLCNKCLTTHNNWSDFNEHVVLTMDELAKPKNQAKARGKPRCLKHEKKTLKFYCETCNELVCTHCIVLDHAKANHSCLPIDEVAEKRRELLRASSVILHEQHKEGNKVLQKIEANTESLKNNAKKAKDDITQQKKAILKAITQKLEEKAALMINEVDRKYNEVYEPLTQQKTDVKAYVDKVKGSMDVAKNLLEKGSHEEVIYIQRLVEENVAKVKRERPWIMKPIHDGNIQFKAKPIVPAMDDGTILNNLGEVVCDPVTKPGKDETINKVAKQVDKITSDQIRREIEEDEIENLSEADISRIKKIGKENNVEVKIEKSINRIIVRGHFGDIGTVQMKIRSILNEIKLAEQEKETAEMVTVQWYWIDTDGSQAEYDVYLNSKIEKAFIKGKKSVTFELDEGKCELVFDKMQETNKKTGQKTEVVRKDLKAKAYISVPDYWDPHPKDSKGKECPVHVVRLDPQNNADHRKKYKNISDGFLQTAPNQTIQKIERIQNPSLFKLYALKKQSMDERDGSNEKFLYLGTSTAKVVDINKNGLNRSYNGVNGTAYGKGIYFARDASLTAGYAKPDASGNRSMYVVRVSVGQYTRGNSAMIVPPDSYDSVVNNPTAPTIFISFYDNQYYPEYLITFR